MLRQLLRTRVQALLPPQASSFAVRPVSCFDLPPVTSSLFERPLFDVPLLPSCVQKAIFTTPELINGQSPAASFNFDFQVPVLPEFDLAEPVRTPLRCGTLKPIRKPSQRRGQSHFCSADCAKLGQSPTVFG